MPDWFETFSSGCLTIGYGHRDFSVMIEEFLFHSPLGGEGYFHLRLGFFH